MTINFWTSEKAALLRELHAQGLSSSQMAKELGATRNMVVGKCKRLALPLKRYRAPVKPAPKERDKACSGASRKRKKDDRPGVSVMDAKVEHCRWPIGESPWRFCGEPAVAPHSWCREHAKKVYREPPSEYSAKAAATSPLQAPADDTADSEGQTLGAFLSDSRNHDPNPPSDAPVAVEEGESWIASSGWRF
jgi:hypothetical protein